MSSILLQLSLNLTFLYDVNVGLDSLQLQINSIRTKKQTPSRVNGPVCYELIGRRLDY